MVAAPTSKPHTRPAGRGRHLRGARNALSTIQKLACSEVASLEKSQSRDVSAQSKLIESRAQRPQKWASDRESLGTRLRRVQAKFGRGIHGDENVLQQTPPAEMKEALEL